MPVSGVKVVVSEGKSFDPLPTDVYQCELLDVEYKEQKAWKSEDMEDVLVFTFAVIEEGEHYGRRLWQYAKPKLSKFKGGSNLYKVLVGLNGGKQLTDEECAMPEVVCSDDALNDLIGKQVRLSVGQKEKQDKSIKNFVESYLPVKAVLPAFNQSKVVGETEEEGAESDEISFDK